MKPTRSLAAAAVALVAAATVPAPTAQAAPITIQPGARSVSPIGGCTLNFIYDGVGSKAGEVYAGSASHCVGGVGSRVRDGAGTWWGTVAARGWAGGSGPIADDWALIRVDPAYHGFVSAAVKGHPSYPTGVAGPGETSFGDLVQLSGYGMVFSTTSVSREQRRGTLTANADGAIYTSTAPALFGDSGGPAIHIGSGQAIGITTNLCGGGACLVKGPTIHSVIAKATAAGTPVVLRTV